MTATERAIIGALMKCPDRLAESLEACPPERFSDPYLQPLYELLANRWKAGQPIDSISLTEAVALLGSTKLPPAAEVMGLPDEVPSVEALPAWWRAVTDAHNRREVLRLAEWLTEQASGGAMPAELLTRAQQGIGRLANRVDDGKGPQMLGDLADQALDRYTSPAAADTPIPTGLESLDRALNGGWRRGELVVIGGRPAMGKTALALTSALHSTIDDQHSVLIFSAEMQASAIADRIVASWAGISFSRIRRPGSLSLPELQRIDSERHRMRSVRLGVDDRKRPTMATIEAVAKRHQARFGLDLVVIDYFQILGLGKCKTQGDKLEARQDLANGLMALAGELNCAVLLLSQLNRDVTRREDKRPGMQDLKATGALEEAAHVILMPYRPHEDDEHADPTEGLIVIPKQRSGPSGQISVCWDSEQVAYVDAMPDVEEQFFGAAK